MWSSHHRLRNRDNSSQMCRIIVEMQCRPTTEKLLFKRSIYVNNCAGRDVPDVVAIHWLMTWHSTLHWCTVACFSSPTVSNCHRSTLAAAELSLFHRLTRTAYLYNGCLAWYNVVITSRSTQAWNTVNSQYSLVRHWNKCVKPLPVVVRVR